MCTYAYMRKFSHPLPARATGSLLLLLCMYLCGMYARVYVCMHMQVCIIDIHMSHIYRCTSVGGLKKAQPSHRVHELIHMYTLSPRTHTYIHANLHTHMHTHTSTNMYTYSYTYIHEYKSTCVQT